MSPPGLVRFERIVYVTPDDRGDGPVRHNCFTYYERFPDGRSAESHAFEAEHGRRQAMDIDEVTWNDGQIRPRDSEHDSSEIEKVRRYLGLEAICRCHFRVVLDGWYDAAHRDHLHCEDLGPVPPDHAARSHVVFCQAVCNALFGAALTIDGVWGGGTEAAMDDAQRRVGVAGDLTGDRDEWVRRLTAVAGTALRGEAFVAGVGGR